MKKILIASAVAFTLVACGGGGDDATAVEKPVVPVVPVVPETPVVPVEPEFNVRELKIAELLGHKQPDDIKTLCRSSLVSCTVIKNDETGEEGVYFKSSLTSMMNPERDLSFMYFWPLNANNDDPMVQTEFLFESIGENPETDKFKSSCGLGDINITKDKGCKISTDKNGIHRIIASYNPYYEFYTDLESQQKFTIFAHSAYGLDDTLATDNRTAYLDGREETEAFSILLEIMEKASEGNVRPINQAVQNEITQQIETTEAIDPVDQVKATETIEPVGVEIPKIKDDELTDLLTQPIEHIKNEALCLLDPDAEGCDSEIDETPVAGTSISQESIVSNGQIIERVTTVVTDIIDGDVVITTTIRETINGVMTVTKTITKNGDPA